MTYVDNLDELIIALDLDQRRPLLLGIDGRPCSGKSTLADMLAEKLDADSIFLDDFFIPQQDWPKDIKPAFPFPYFHNEQFVNSIKDLSQGQVFSYSPFDWSSKKLSSTRSVDPKKPIIVEGVSVLREELSSCYFKKIFVISDRSSELEAISKREGKALALWFDLYLPSVDIYWQTKPWKRADILYAGRGVKDKNQIDMKIQIG